MDLKSYIRNVPDFPKKGIVFKDITTLLKEPEAFHYTLIELCKPYRNKKPDMIVGIESRGFIFGGAMAIELNTGFVPVRKAGKLPADTAMEEYSLEYGIDRIEIHRDAISKGMKVLVVDDLLATGGTAAATIRLVKKLEGEVMGIAFLIELSFLEGRKQLIDVPVHVLMQYQTES
jgi:adenine phosphoribosyltransferase